MSDIAVWGRGQASPEFTPERREVFYERVAQTGLLGASAVFAGVSVGREIEARKSDPDHARKTEEALTVFRASVEAEIKRRAIEGVEKPLSFQGRLTGDSETVYSDHLLIALAKRHIPEYRNGEKGATGPTNEAQSPLEIDFAALSREKREALRVLLGPDKAVNETGPVEDAVIIDGDDYDNGGEIEEV